jgi:hypothetical protein
MTIVKLFDRVSLDGRPGTAVGFFSVRRERSVLVRFDHAEVLEVPEARLVPHTLVRETREREARGLAPLGGPSLSFPGRRSR